MRVLFAAVFILSLSTQAGAQELTASIEEVVAPPELSEAVRDRLHDQAVVVSRDDARIELWPVRQFPVETSGRTPEWSEVPAGALMGALRLEGPLPDIRGVPIKPGVYTLRFARQPQDGDHLGASPYREFLVVAPAAEDTASHPLGYEAAVRLGKRTQGRSHPAVLSIDPLASGEPPGSTVDGTEAGHRAVVFTAGSDASATAMTFGVILVGRIDH